MTAAPAGAESAADGIRCMMMRAGTSRGLYFLASDLPGGPPSAIPCCSASWAAVIRCRSTASVACTR